MFSMVTVPRLFVQPFPNDLSDPQTQAVLESEVLAREWGDRWIESNAHSDDLLKVVPSLRPVQAVPSIVIPFESNYLINPEHRLFRVLQWSEPIPFYFDPRLILR
jgi:RES domain-containing protein